MGKPDQNEWNKKGDVKRKGKRRDRGEREEGEVVDGKNPKKAEIKSISHLRLKY